jgi:AcrR family transcriptional regulator
VVTRHLDQRSGRADGDKLRQHLRHLRRKEAVFTAAIDRYLETVAKNLMAELSDRDPRRAIERMFDSIVRRISDPRLPRGCLIVNTSLECPTAGDVITRKIGESIGQQETAIYRLLLRAQPEGSLAPTQDPRAPDHFFLGVAQEVERDQQNCGGPGGVPRHRPDCHEDLG